MQGLGIQGVGLKTGSSKHTKNSRTMVFDGAMPPGSRAMFRWCMLRLYTDGHVKA